MFIFADVVWPGLILTGHLAIWHIAIGLLIEAAFVYYIYKASIRDTIVMTVVVNVLSTIVGIILIPLLGIGWELFPGFIIHLLFHIGTFNLFTWTGTFIFATAANTTIETWGLKKFFKRTVDRRVFLLMFLANAISVGLAISSIYFSPLRGEGPGIF